MRCFWISSILVIFNLQAFSQPAPNRPFEKKYKALMFLLESAPDCESLEKVAIGYLTETMSVADWAALDKGKDPWPNKEAKRLGYRYYRRSWHPFTFYYPMMVSDALEGSNLHHITCGPLGGTARAFVSRPLPISQTSQFGTAMKLYFYEQYAAEIKRLTLELIEQMSLEHYRAFVRRVKARHEIRYAGSLAHVSSWETALNTFFVSLNGHMNKKLAESAKTAAVTVALTAPGPRLRFAQIIEIMRQRAARAPRGYQRLPVEAY